MILPQTLSIFIQFEILYIQLSCEVTNPQTHISSAYHFRQTSLQTGMKRSGLHKFLAIFAHCRLGISDLLACSTLYIINFVFVIEVCNKTNFTYESSVDCAYIGMCFNEIG